MEKTMTNPKIKINLDALKSRRDWTRHKVKDGHNIFRILPPFGEACNGYPFRKWMIVWGLVDPASGRMRPFASSMTSEKRCPVSEFVGELKKRAEVIRAKMQSNGSSDDDIKGRLSGLNELISNLSLKTVYVYNAVDKSGTVGLLELKSTAHKKMKTEMNQYIQDYNQDPTSLGSADDDSGVWFDVTRQGMGRDTEYDVKKCQTKVKTPTGKFTFEDDRSPLPENVVENFNTLAYDLLSIYQIKTFDELQEVLEANLSAIVELVPDADLSVEPSFGTQGSVATPQSKVAAPRPVQNTAAKPAAKVAINLQEEDDEEPVKPAAKKASAMLDDDFMNEADAILNG
jgi:hypothetical protein